MKKSALFLLLSIVLLLLTAVSVSAKENVLTIPFSRQTRAYGCGQNTFRMIMGYWGERLPIERIYGYTGFNSSTRRDFQNIIKRHFSDFQFKEIDKNIDSVIKAIDNNRPVMVETNAAFLTYLPYQSSGGHYIAAIGYNTEKEVIYVRDPNSYYVEELKYEDLKKAWGNKNMIVFTIYKKNGKFVKADNIKHFSDKAKPFGAEKEETTTPFYAYLIPSLYTVMNTSERGIANTTLLDDWLYTVKVQGIHFGHLNLERSPWLYQDIPFYGLGANVGVNLGTPQFLFGASDALSPGVFRFLRTRTMDIRSFSSIKSVPSLTMPTLSLEATGYISLLDVMPEGTAGPYPLANPYSRLSNIEDSYKVQFSKLRGGRFNIRHGLDQTWGYLSGAVTLTSVDVTSGDVTQRLDVIGGDVTIGPVEGALQYHLGSFEEGVQSRVLAYSAGLNLNLPQLSGGLFTVLDFIGLFRAYYQFRHEEFSFETEDISFDVVQNVHRLELPMNLKFVHLIYGFDLGYSEGSFDHFTIGGRLLFNLFLPYFQAQAGYNYTAKANEPGNHALHIGIYAGLW